jgi:hypothetical protein
MEIINYVTGGPSWEANSFSASQDIYHILWNSKFHYRIYNNLPLVPLQSHMDAIDAISYNFSKIHLSIILPSVLWYSRWPPFYRSCISALSHAYYIPNSAHPPWFYHGINIWRGLLVTWLLIMQLSLGFPYLRHLTHKHSFSILFWSIFSLCSCQRPICETTEKNLS